jgi:glutamate-1-semialdehyde aminotransferase
VRISPGCICGRDDLMDTADPARKDTLEQACLSGTLSGNPLTCAVGLVALEELSRPLGGSCRIRAGQERRACRG